MQGPSLADKLEVTKVPSNPAARLPGLVIDPYYGTGRKSKYARFNNYQAQKDGFRSKRQWRWAYATKQPWARAAVGQTEGGPKIRYQRLPQKKVWLPRRPT